MAGKATFTTEEIEKIIREEMALDEGFLSRVMARARGNQSALKTLGTNVSQVFKAVAQGKTDLIKDPRLMKALTTGMVRIKDYEKKFSAVMIDFISDMKIMFGENFENAPDALKSRLNVWGEESKDLLDLTQMVGKDLEDLIKGKASENPSTEEPIDTQANVSTSQQVSQTQNSGGYEQ